MYDNFTQRGRFGDLAILPWTWTALVSSDSELIVLASVCGKMSHFAESQASKFNSRKGEREGIVESFHKDQ